MKIQYLGTAAGERIPGIFCNCEVCRRAMEKGGALPLLDKAEKDGEVVPCDDLPKSFVLTSEYGFTRVRLTSLNSVTLEKRLK